MKIGDKVRFMSSTGGGKVVGFQSNNVVLVEDADGFQIPTSIMDVIVVDDDDYSTSRVMAKGDKPMAPSPKKEEIEQDMPVLETKVSNQLSAYMAFTPINIKEFADTAFETYFVNDSNYYMRYSYLTTANGKSWSLRSCAEVAPNTTVFIEGFSREEVNEISHVAVQLIAYKKDKSFDIKPTVDVQLRIDPVKFYKLHTFVPNDFFDTPALLYPIVENDVSTKPLVIISKSLKESMYKTELKEKENDYNTRYEHIVSKGNPLIIKHKGDTDTVVVDLHASEILETTAGMSANDILNYQIKVFNDTLNEYEGKVNQKIIFIHGKGNGILRSKIIGELNHLYKKYSYQDASFQEYGYGATQVTIK